ncbi:MAG: hypothetical protein NVSMB39_4810 [Candidatus Saccharimonadales bacterium]
MNRILRAAEALGVPKVTNFKRKLAKIVAVAMALSGLALNAGMANAATLTSAKMSLTDPRPSSTAVSYNFTGSSVSASLIKCVKEVFATTSTGTTKPTNMTTATGITINASSTLLTAANWTRGGADADGTVTFTYATGETPTAGTKTFNLDGFVNSSVADTSFFIRFNTYSDTTCATAVDSTTVEYILTNGSTLSLSVDPSLTFTVNAVAGSQACDGTTTTAASTATTIPFGTVTSSANAVVCQDLTAASNSTNGYTVYARYTAAPSNTLSQTIADWTGTNSAPTAFSAAGTEAYGYTTNDAALGTGTANRFTSPSQGWAKMTTSNNEVVYEPNGVSATTFRIGHQVGVSTTTKPGTYTTTIIYTCTPVY